ncbi:hypothetical protein LCGC14_2691240 [marine sediment metagenome]|uniref:Uncharacterized protein n=1 Tax=marine sediment metagenome TaxID=412755 RepID=A0A0F8ZII5_9ZZZZ
MFFIIDATLFAFAILSVAIYFSSAYRIDWPLTASALVSVLANVIAYHLESWVPSLLLLPGSLFISASVLLYDQTIISSENPGDKYFSCMEYGLIIFAGIMLVSVFRYGLKPDDIFIILFLFLGCATWFCQKSNRNDHKKRFLIYGTLSISIWCLAIIFHPIIAGFPISLENINKSIRLNAGYTIFLAMFFLGNYGKLGYLQDKALHKKIFSIFFAMYSLSIFMRYPQFAPFLKTIPHGDKLPAIAFLGFIGFPPVVGLILRKGQKTR